MNGICKIDRIGSCGKCLDVSGRREAVHRVRIQLQIRFQRVEEFLVIGQIDLPVKYLAKPAHLLGFGFFNSLSVRILLVFPVRSDTVFGSPVHLMCSYLYLERSARRPDESRMKALIHVGLGHGDIVFKSSRYGLVHFMNDTERRITIRDRIDDYPDRKQVIDLIQCLVLIEHFAVYGHEMLYTAVNCSLNTRISYVFSNILDYIRYILLTL